MDSQLALLTSPGERYLDAFEAAMCGATSVRLITAFATTAGLERLMKSLGAVLEAPGGQARIVLAVDRGHFNADPLFRELLAIRRRYSPRLSVGLVAQTRGLLHAKALFAEGPARTTLIIGSANMTESAFARNFELGLAVTNAPRELIHAFRRFEKGLEARTLDDESAEAFLEERGLMTTSPAVSYPPPQTDASWKELVAKIQSRETLPEIGTEPAGVLHEWIDRGYLVGRGRRGTDALVLRVPLESLERRGLAVTTRRSSLGEGARESRTQGYQLELLSEDVAESVRRESRRVSRLLTRLALNLPCFGLWMPESYWTAFIELRQRILQGDVLGRDNIVAAATERRRRLLEEGGLESGLEVILNRMIEGQVVESSERERVRSYLLPELRRQLVDRTPELIADAMEFRTARQRWSPFEKTDTPYRQLMCDVIQAVFLSTLRTGAWPRRFNSLAARQLALAIASKLQSAGGEANGVAAQRLLDQASTWESQQRSFSEVVDEFRSLVPLSVDFATPDWEELMSNVDEREVSDDN